MNTTAIVSNAQWALTRAELARIEHAFAAWDADLAGMRAEPVVIEAQCLGPLAITRAEDISLDGLLLYSALQAILREDYYLLGPLASPDWTRHIRLPLAAQGPDAAWALATPSGSLLTGAPRWWWWACSTMELAEVVARATDHYNKRFDSKPSLSEHLAFPAGARVEKVDISGGRYKMWHQPVPVVTCRAVRWHAVGDAVLVRELLADVASIGKHRARGYGAVRDWRVTPEPDGVDRSLWRDGKGEGEKKGTGEPGKRDALARPVPVDALHHMDGREWDAVAESSGRSYIAYRAPQWLPAHQAVCAVAW